MTDTLKDCRFEVGQIVQIKHPGPPGLWTIVKVWDWGLDGNPKFGFILRQGNIEVSARDEDISFAHPKRTSMTDHSRVRLENEMEDLRARLDRLEDRVQLDATAQRFLAGIHLIREGDAFQMTDGHAARLGNISSEGKWSYLDRLGRRIEPHRVPPEEGIERLYTIAEVAEILAVARREGR